MTFPLGGTSEYELIIYAADGTTPAVTITSTRGGTNPYLHGIPNGDGASFNPLTGESMLGAYTVEIVDWSIGSMQRVMTSQLEDPTSHTPQLGYRKARLRIRTDGGSWIVMIHGILTLVRTINDITFSVTISDPMRAQLIEKLFAPDSDMAMMDFLAAWPTRGCLLGGPVIADPAQFLDIKDLGGWSMKVEAVAGGQYYLRPLTTYGPPRWMQLISSHVDDVVSNTIDAATDAFGKMLSNSENSPWTSIADCTNNGWAWRGITLLISTDKGVTWLPWKPLAIQYSDAVDVGGGIARTSPVLVGTTKNEQGIKVISDGTRTLTNGATVRVRALTILPSEISPIYINDHPVDVLITLWDSVTFAYNTTACNDLRTLIGNDARITLRITSARDLAALVQTVCGRFGIGIRANEFGELVPFDARLGRDNTKPTLTITDADVVSGSVRVAYELDPAQALKTVVLKQKLMVSAKSSAQSEVVDGVIVSDWDSTIINNATVGLPFGTLEISTDGMARESVRGTSGATPQLADEALAQRIFDRFGYGAVAVELTLIRGTPSQPSLGDNAAVVLGTEIVVAVSQSANANYRLGDNVAIAGRAMQIVRRTVVPTGYAVRLIDSGANAQPLSTVPTLSIAASSDLPRTVATVTVTNAAALNALGYAVRLQWAVTSGGAPSAGDYTDAGKVYGAGLIPTTAFRLSPVVAGSRIYVKARSEGVPSARPSNYGTAVNLTLSAIADPTGVGATPSGTDGSLCVLAWTPGTGTTAAGDLTDIYLRASADAFALAVRQDTLNPGSNTFTLQGLTPGVAYKASVQHRDPHTQDVSDPVDVSFTAGGTTRTLAYPVYPQPFAGSIDPVTGVPVRDGIYGIGVVAAERPGFVEVAEAVETSVGSGSYGSFATVGVVPSVQADWTTWSTVAPNDGLRRRLKARHIATGATSSAYTSTVDVLPWTPFVLIAYPTQLFIEFDINDPADAITDVYDRIRVHVLGIDPQGGTPEVRLNVSANMSLYSGPTLNTWEPNNSLWILNVPKSTAGMGSITADTRVGTRMITATLPVPPRMTFAQSQGTGAVDANGNWQFTADGGDDALSFRWDWSLSGFPNDATTAASGAIVTGSGRLFDVAGGSPIDGGDTVFATVVPFTATGAGGVAMLPIHLRAAYLNVNGTKTIRFPVTQGVKVDIVTSTNTAVLTIGSTRCYVMMGPPTIAASVANVTWGVPFQLPAGSTIEQISAYLYWASAGATAQAILTRDTPYNAYGVGLAYANGSNTGTWDLCVSSVIAEPVTTGNSYFATLYLTNADGPIDYTKQAGSDMFITYTPDDLQATL